jgi:choline dehydrogenase-like flavoprotein
VYRISCHRRALIDRQTAGLVLAARLTEDAAVSVLVVEAGPANLHDPALLRPASYATHFGNPAYDWACAPCSGAECLLTIP